MSPLVWIAVPILGGLASVARFLLVKHALPHPSLPLATLAINVSGSFALGVLTGAGVTGDTALLIGGATIGTFTTFSGWMLDSHQLHRDGATHHAAANIAGSLALGFAALALGYVLGQAG